MNLTFNMLYVQNSEFPSENIIKKNLGLYIHINVDDITIKKILINTNYNVNTYFINLL